ncbi:hypothetical protein FB45DRAFT_1040957 [Roridomyces roridus]|uniref:Uncharacterized protein n=1 Tax=Roridomyces roridus TaxID=1738132 RepID=A0AAD7B0N3_9AGAR|nr:hypothetical protein FB45DRAFT_1040957 [Roridomyces roridus]
MSIRRFKGRLRTWQVLGSTTGVDDCAPAPPVKKLRLGPMKLAQYQDNRAIQLMSTTNRQNLLALQEMAAAPEFDASNAPDLLTVAGVLDGTHEAQISHAGGDHGGETLEDIIELTERARTRCKDTRTRRDRTQKRNDAFAALMYVL